MLINEITFLISKYIAFSCIVYSIIILFVSLKIKINRAVLFLGLTLFFLSIFSGFNFIIKDKTGSQYLFLLNFQYIFLFISFSLTALVLLNLGLNKKIFYFSISVFIFHSIVIAQSFLTNYNFLFKINQGRLESTFYYNYIFFTSLFTVFAAAVINLIKNANNIENKFYAKLLKKIIIGTIFLAFFGTLSMIIVIVFGEKTSTVLSLSLIGIFIFAVYSFIFITDILLHAVKRKMKLEPFIKQSELNKNIDRDFDLIVKEIKEKKIFLNTELTLSLLAKELDINRNQLSDMINKNTGKNFNAFINQLRLNFFLSEFLDDKNTDTPILELALNCGFNSKATFNRFFKEFYKMSPKEYKKKYQG